MLIGYARVSTRDQRLTLHIDALERGQEELILRPDDYELIALSFYIQFLNRTIQVGILVLTKTELCAVVVSSSVIEIH